MKDYFLFIDTETSGLPKKWDLPYDAPNNWPHILQLAWLIFDKDGNEIKRENHYIRNDKVKISKTSQNIHHITKEFLKKNGKEISHVLPRFAKDLATYKPLIVAHFVELDFHMVSVEFFREKINSCINELPVFCTMKASKPYIKNPSLKYLKLNRFYKTLFNKPPEKLHDALADAELTSEIFFRLLKNGEINNEAIAHQQTLFNAKEEEINPFFKWIGLLIIILLTILISHLAHGK
ncbi:3'-5' exonuclease [Pedobacter sp. SD-b]|uniref:3'-5' exonuclease n=1 Tax=Pedobacter segetis TaxID=2793069 RepID=A0ABS1BJP3_9SPHI|nr:3'-5' exonuclease [Pedobacter segetis]MBK0382434.1 3'-5' exonuclease [Pedobacter segetis]